MKLIDLYYQLKPFVPRRAQIFLRRKFSAHKLKHVQDVWPINPETARPPEGWNGWPDKKKFALLLHHDVDTALGLEQCNRLMDLEKRLGFLSQFNFVPEGYAVPGTLRQSLAESCFEIGVHGLTHDGKLFRRRADFDEKAVRINHYLREWGAVSFSSPSMVRNLSWIGDLNIEHDCSSFDTDPFEPQPESSGTIFPFFISNISKTRTYVELPYTLPQDHNLFIILRERDITLWIRKLDWVAENGGMALLITHPDYMNFNATRCSYEQYPISHYINFLEYIKSRYAGQYWHVLPRELAQFWRKTMLREANAVTSGRAEQGT